MFTSQPLSLSRLNQAILAVFLSSATATAYAEQAEPSATLETIYVTAQKIDRTSQETVDSVKLVTEQQLKDQNNKDYTQLFESTVNVSLNKENDFNIRGISFGGPTNNSSGAAAHSIIVDGVPQSKSELFKGSISTWDLDKVEVLRGPQSTTTGRNSLAGAIVLKSNAPDFDDGGEVQVGYGNNNTYQAAATLTGGVTDNLAYRFSAEQKHTDGAMDNPNFDDDFNGSDNTALRGQLLYFINDDNEVKLIVSHKKFEETGSNDSVQDNKRLNLDNDLAELDVTVDNVAVEYTSYLNDEWKLQTTTAYNKSKTDQKLDNDGATANSVWVRDRDTEGLSQEILFNYDDDDKLKAVVGVYAAKEDRTNITNANDWVVKLYGVPLTLNYFSDFENGYENYAAFFNADYKITPKLTVLSGLRYDYDKRNEGSNSTAELLKGTGNAAIDKQILGIIEDATGGADGDKSNSVVLPKFGFDYAWSDNVNTGILYQRGYRPGGASTNLVKKSVREFDPEYTDNYEMSLRIKDNNNKLAFSTNLFYTDWQDQQVTVSQSPLPFDTYVTNAGKSHLYGAEVEGSYQISPQVKLNAGVGTVKTEFDEFENNGEDLSGKEFAYARDLNANVGMTYRDDMGWFVNTNATYNGNAFRDINNEEFLDPYTLVNVKTGYEQDNWAIYANVNNLFDEKYVYNTFNTEQGKEYYLGDSRNYGLTVNYKW